MQFVEGRCDETDLERLPLELFADLVQRDANGGTGLDVAQTPQAFPGVNQSCATGRFLDTN
jgi:hypothetical protein